MADLALQTAIDILEDTVCECGHVEGDHITDLSLPHGRAECAECTCELFEPVEFSVTRRDGSVR